MSYQCLYIFMYDTIKNRLKYSNNWRRWHTLIYVCCLLIMCKTFVIHTLKRLSINNCESISRTFNVTIVDCYIITRKIQSWTIWMSIHDAHQSILMVVAMMVVVMVLVVYVIFGLKTVRRMYKWYRELKTIFSGIWFVSHDERDTNMKLIINIRATLCSE